MDLSIHWREDYSDYVARVNGWVLQCYGWVFDSLGVFVVGIEKSTKRIKVYFLCCICGCPASSSFRVCQVYWD